MTRNRIPIPIATLKRAKLHAGKIPTFVKDFHKNFIEILSIKLYLYPCQLIVEFLRMVYFIRCIEKRFFSETLNKQ